MEQSRLVLLLLVVLSSPSIHNTVISIHPQISAEAAYLYDAVHLYANALLSVLDAGDRPRNGTAIVAAIKGSRYRSAMG